MMKFEFATAARIIFGPGTIQEVAPLAAEMGKCAFIVTGSTGERARPLLEQLDRLRIEYTTFGVVAEPTTTVVTEAVELARQANCDLVLSMGGGSVLDTGKAIAVMLANPGRLEDYLEVVGQGRPLAQSPVPHIAIPTTAGTGTEVTRNAVLAVPEHKVKVSMRSPLMLPRVAVVDPLLTHTMPPSVTASTGLDALTQLMEAYVSNKASPLTDGICREGLKRAGHSLRRAYEDGSDGAAREDMAMASLFSGLALANAKLGAVHGLAGPLGGMTSAPHGVVCARLLPYVIETNISALQDRAVDSPALARYAEVAQLLTGKVTARATDGLTWVQDLCRVLEVPPLAEYGFDELDFADLVAKSQKSSSMKGNPVLLTADELMLVLQKSR